MRNLVRGLVAGSVLSCLRAPLGVELLEWGAVGARTSYEWRTAALAVVALGAWAAGQATLSVRFLLGILVGFAIHGLFLANVWSPGGTVSLALTACAGFALLAAVRSPAVDVAGDPPKFLEMIGIAVAAAGAAIALDGVAREVRIFGAGLAQDDSLSVVVWIALATAGLLSFGWIAGARVLRGISLPIALAGCACACRVSLAVIARLVEPRGLGAYLKHFGLDASRHGTLAYDALISAAILVVPALVLGAGLAGARGRSRILAVLLGAAVGLFLVPSLLALDPRANSADAQPSCAEIVALGGLVAALGAVVAILSLSDRGAVARWSGIGAALALAAPALSGKAEPVHVLSPWARRPVFPSYVADTPEGLVTVESFGILGGAWVFVTVDRHLVTPDFDDAVADALRFRSTIELVPPEHRRAGGIRMLLVGQLSPERARILADAGVRRVDRTAAWWSSMSRVEDALWAALPEDHARPEGDIVAPSEARARMARGDYDVVLAPPVRGDAPRAGTVDVPESTTVVRWIDLDEPAVHRKLPERVAVLLDGLERPALALVDHGAASSAGPYAPLLVRPGPARAAPTPLAWLLVPHAERDDARATAARAAMFTRLAAGERGGPLEDTTTAFELFFDAQVPSSQFETAVDRVELPDACLDRFRAAALAGAPDPSLRRTWETIAQVLAGKRWIEKIYAYARPVAEKNRTWPALEKALAKADLESLQPQDALHRLEPLRLTIPEDFELWYLLGNAQCAAGDPSAATESWRRAVWLKTSDRLAKRKIALALTRSGDAEGREAARGLLLETPGDEELKALLTQPTPSGPLPDPCSP
ncbi:MAG TPA: hypothetical protein VGR31_07240 [Planctomycetota bacterium]|jgi:hypothetical protein|nr:hypothetical protein [Planctomycetota bacterium]